MDRIERKLDLCEIEIDGDIDSLISVLQNLKKNYKSKGFFKFCIEEETIYDYNGEYKEHRLYGFRLENDTEFKIREQKNKKRIAANKIAAKNKQIKKQKREMEIYKRLHDKFKGEIIWLLIR